MSGLDNKLNQIQQRAQARVDHYKGLILSQGKLSDFHNESLQIAMCCLSLIRMIDKLREQRNDETRQQGDDFAWQPVYDKNDKQIEMELDK